MRTIMTRLFLLSLISATAACSTVQTPSPADPYEGFNRTIESLNYSLDKAIIKPVARGYQAALPEQIRGCVSNFFSNISDVFIAVNNALQGKGKDALSDLCRVGINTTIGMVGLFDVASDLGFEKHNEDFGQTFGRWGAASGPYLVLPFFGPSTIRDGIGFGFDMATNPLGNVSDVPLRNSLTGTRIVDTRANYLEATDTVDKIALDRYSFVRDAFLARRQSLVYDGNPPRKKTSALDDEFLSQSNAKPMDSTATSPWTDLEPVSAQSSGLKTVELPVGERSAQLLGVNIQGK